jgi:hypothetical protein
MRSVDVFCDPELAELSEDAASKLLLTLQGQKVAVGLLALFAIFVGIAGLNDIDPGTEFETMLAALEGRKCATHRGSLAVN